MRMGTRGKAVVQPVSLSSSRSETWGKLSGSQARLCARFLARVSWCPGCVGGPGRWPSFPVLCVGLVSSSGSFSFPFFLKRSRPRAPTQGPIFRQVFPSTYDLLGRGTGYWVFFIHFPYRFFLRLFLRTPSSRFRPTGWGLWKSLHVQSGLSVEVAPLYVSFVLPLGGIRVEEDMDQKFDSCTHCLVAMTSASHAEGRQFDLGWV